MKRSRLATTATLIGVLLSAGCAGPCGCGGGFHRMSMFRARRACPCECCSSCGGGGVPIVGGGADFGDGPLLEPPGAPMSAMPPFSAVPPSAGMAMPDALPSLGAPPLGVPSVPTDPGRIMPTPLNGAQPFPAGPSSRVRSR